MINFYRTIRLLPGYGHIVPVTWLGRLTTIGYSLFGIPLFLVLLAESGLLLTRMIKFFWVYYIRFSATPAGKRFVSSGIIQVRIHSIPGIKRIVDLENKNITEAGLTIQLNRHMLGVSSEGDPTERKPFN